jgi:hypothetical protein
MARCSVVRAAWLAGLAGVAVAVAAPGRAAAQAAAQPAIAAPTAPVTRIDVAGVAGWAGTQPAGEGEADRWMNGAAAGATAGWYWTDHLKTELAFLVVGPDTVWTAEPLVIPGLPYVNYRSVEHEFRARTLSIAQGWQFFRNAWFHPIVAAGLDVDWRRTTRSYPPQPAYDWPAEPPGWLPEQPPETQTRVRASPFVSAGFKAYVSPRAFFRGEIKAGPAHSARVAATVGFGVDFPPPGGRP